ncbi:hypothetical protein ACLKA7_002703 [Drosophila subpalustris]
MPQETEVTTTTSTARNVVIKISANGTSHFYTPMPGYAAGPGPTGNGPPHYHMPPPPPGAGAQQQQQQQQPTSAGSVGGGGSATTQQPHIHSPHPPSPPNYRDERSQRQHTKLLRKLEKKKELNSAMSTPTHSPSPRRSDINGHHSNNNNSNNNNNIPMAQHMHNNNNNNGRRLPQQQQQQQQQQQMQQQQRNGHVPNSMAGQQQVQVAGVSSSSSCSSHGEDNSSLAAEEEAEADGDGDADGDEEEEEEDYQATIVEQISAIEKPEVIDISSRAAKIIWVSPAITDAMLVDLQQLRYQVLLSDTAKQCKYKSLYRGEAYECIVQDLQPGQEYLVRLQVHYKQLQGAVTEPTEFKTPPCEPDQPLPPKLVSRTKSSINLRWSAPAFNGASIQHYLLEYDEGRGSGAQQFVELAKTKAKHYVISKLQPSTVYSFRLAAVNEIGQSMYSQVVGYSTAGNPPSCPRPPQLQSCTSSSLRLVWDRRSQDGEFLLQLQDVDAGHGYMNGYKGSETHYECLQLRRATSYQFRLRAENEAGASPWSTEVSYSTASERPGRPGKPHAKGKIHGTHFKARWEAPADTGGADILRYHLELAAGSSFERIYSGHETEAMCERLQPGTTYQLRACCEGPAGQSPFSEVASVTTEAVPPAAPPPPHCDAPATPYAALVRLSQPEYNGGAQVLEFEAQLRQPDNLDMPPRSVYRGKQDYFVAQQLVPGGVYEVQARAINRIGAGNWSQWLRFTAAAAPPGCPESLQVVVKSATQLSVSWQPPMELNGSAVSGYSLQSVSRPCGEQEQEEEEPPSTQFHGCYQGAQTSVELRNLLPYTRYFLRVLASNAAGLGSPSDVVCVATPAAVPGAPQMQGYEFTAQEVTLNWTQPASHGACITHYNIECGERTIATPDACTRYTILELTPETSYKLRVQAVNAVGAGAFSAYAKLTTQPAPPAPPRLECSGAGHNYIKLKWSDGRASATREGGAAAASSDFTKYFVEMYVARAKQFQSVYSGTNTMCKVHKLQERSSYTFRIYAHTDRAGDGDYSEEFVFATTATLPANIKAPRVVHESSVCLLDQAGQLAMQLTLEWQHSKNSFHDRVEYQLQYAVDMESASASASSSCSSSSSPGSSEATPVALSNQEYRQLYRGPETKFTIDNLAAGSCYQFRVCAVRVTASGELFPGQPSTALRYKVPTELSPSRVPTTTTTMACHHLQPIQNQRSSRKLSTGGHGANNGNHLRSVSASAITGSGSGVGADPQAIGRLQHELSSLNACGDPLHHHHHHHHHHQQQQQQLQHSFPVDIATNSNSNSNSTASSTLLLRGRDSSNVLAAGHHLHHQHHNHMHHSHHMHHAHFTHPAAANAVGSSLGSGMPHGSGVVRRVIGRLTTLYCNRKRLTDQQKAVFFVVSFVFVTFLVAMLVHMLWG